MMKNDGRIKTMKISVAGIYVSDAEQIENKFMSKTTPLPLMHSN